MELKCYLLTGLLLFSCISMEAQNSKAFFDRVMKDKDRQEKAPLAYPPVDPSDIVWCKTIWRELMLREKMNLPLYYPTVPVDGRKSLIDVLMHGIDKAFKNAFEDDELEIPLSYDEILKRFGATADTLIRRNVETGEMETVIIPGELHTDEVKRLQVKELWYFNTRTARLEVRIIALCPIREFVKEETEGIQKRMLFWIDYDDFRDLLVKQQVYNFRNDAQRITLDDIFLKRYFSSRIIKETNPYDNRSIQSYAIGIDAVLESDRIQNEIFNYEQDFWEY